MSKNKVFKTLDEQIDILRSKGLCIDDVEEAKAILLRENYFFISGYRHIFMRDYKENRFIEGTTFKELYAMFRFDRHIRNIFFKYLLIIENNAKSIISYQMSRKYGYKEKDYLSLKNYTQDTMKVKQVNDVLNKMKRQIRVNGNKHAATMHYINNYGYIPMWILVKVLSMGIISELYNILKDDDKNEIAEFFKVSSDDLSIYLQIIANFRNLCAHEDILYDHRTQRVIPNNIIHYKMNIDIIDNEYEYGKNDLFALIIILKRLLREEYFKELMFEIGYEVDILEGAIDTIPIQAIYRKIGFPSNWRDIEDI
ncbi:MAG: Abi family protein [Bacilli bacterium]|nr:Abi family protein [Bacilli bacterium]